MFNSQAPAYTNVPLVESPDRLLQNAQKGQQGCAHKVGQLNVATYKVPTCKDPFHVCGEKLAHCMLVVQAPQEASLRHLVLQFLLQGLSSFSFLAEEPGKDRACKRLVAA